jgi:hypothetical protein
MAKVPGKTIEADILAQRVPLCANCNQQPDPTPPKKKAKRKKKNPWDGDESEDEDSAPQATKGLIKVAFSGS